MKLRVIIALIIISLSVLLIVTTQAHAVTVTPSTQPQQKVGNVEGLILLEGEYSTAKIDIVNPSNLSMIYATTYSDKNGRFKFEELPVRKYKLNITPLENRGGWMTDIFQVNNSETVWLTVPITYKKGTISGNVLVEGKPPSNCMILLNDPVQRNISVYKTMTDEKGNFIINDAIAADSKVKPLNVPDNYSLIVLSDSISSAWIRPRNIVLRGDQTLTVNDRITFKKGNITGVVTSEAGTPVVNGKINLFLANETNRSPVIKSILTDKNGTYTFKYITATPGNGTTIWPGEWPTDYQYMVEVYISENMSQYSPSIGLSPDTSVICNFTIPAGNYSTGNIKGRLTTDTGYRANNESIILYGQYGTSGKVVARTTTDQDGHFVFGQVIATNSSIKPENWTGYYWLTYQNSGLDKFTLNEDETAIKNLTVKAQPKIVVLSAEHHYVPVGDECKINAKILDKWGNPYPKQTKIGMEIANNETYNAPGPGAINSGNIKEIIIDVFDGQANFTYGWIHPAYEGWNVTLAGYPYPQMAGTIGTTLTLTILPTGSPYPPEPLGNESSSVGTIIPMPEPDPEVEGTVTPLPEIVTVSPMVEPTQIANSTITGNSVGILEGLWSFVKSLFSIP